MSMVVIKNNTGVRCVVARGRSWVWGRTSVWVACVGRFRTGPQAAPLFPFSFSIPWPPCQAGGWPTAPRFGETRKQKLGALLCHLDFSLLLPPRPRSVAVLVHHAPPTMGAFALRCFGGRTKRVKLSVATMLGRSGPCCFRSRVPLASHPASQLACRPATSRWLLT